MKPRQYPRFETDVRVSFRLPYDFRTEIDFKIEQEKGRGQGQAYIGFSRNISVNGLCFESAKELRNGDMLWIELHLPKSTEIIYMEGEVRWSRLISSTPGAINQYLSGVVIKKIDGKDVEGTIHFDQEYKVNWSQLLERVFGSFAKLCRKPA